MEIYISKIADNITAKKFDEDELDYYREIIKGMEQGNMDEIKEMNKEMFIDIDDDKNEYIEFDEWCSHMKGDLKDMLGVELDNNELLEIFKRFDENSDEKLSKEEAFEFLKHLFKDIVGPAIKRSDDK